MSVTYKKKIICQEFLHLHGLIICRDKIPPDNIWFVSYL
nr:MAG TPA: hypothetical protein [Microviridae sp.]